MRKNSNSIKSVITLASGSIIAQIISVIVSPIATRLYTPADFGMFTLIFTAIGIFGPILSARLDLSIVSEKNHYMALALTKLSFYLCCVFAILITVGYTVYFIATDAFSVINISFLFILLTITGLTNILNSYNNRMKEYKLMTKVYVIRSIFQNFFQVLFGCFSLGVTGLLSSQCFSQFFSIKKQAKSLLLEKNKMLKITTKDMLLVLKNHKKQIFYSTPAAFANSFSYSSINIFVNNLYGASTLGYYSLSYRVLSLPLNIVSSNVSKVFFEKASREYEQYGNYNKTLKSMIKFLFFLSIPLFVVLEFLLPNLFGFFFGKEWVMAGEYVKILAPMFTIRFVVTALSVGLIVSNQQQIDLLVQMLFIIFSIVIYCVSIYNSISINEYLMLISFSYSLVYLIYFLFIIKGGRKTN